MHCCLLIWIFCSKSSDLYIPLARSIFYFPDAPEVPAKAVAPVVEKHLVDRMVSEGDQQIILQCQVFGSPEPTVTWYFGNRKLPNCGEFEQTYNGVTHVAKMVIAEIFLDDEGEYSCIAENVSGRVKSSCWIAVEGMHLLLIFSFFD